LGRATELLMTGDFIDAAEAYRIGLYNRVTEAGQSLADATAFAERLALGPSLALAVTKDALNKEASMDVLGALAAEAQAQAECMLHPNFREAYEAFVAKRPPTFA
jgi:enoyl-CoA hydratase/carnithine racemase